MKQGARDSRMKWTAKIQKVVQWGSSLLFMLTVVSCGKPTLLHQGAARYRVQSYHAEVFLYVDYKWKGGAFKDAVALEHRFVRWARDQGVLKDAMGRFPTSHDWQLGFTVESVPTTHTFEGLEIQQMAIPAGEYAVLKTEGSVDFLFRYWKPFRRWLKQDHYEVESPVFERYPDILTDSRAKERIRGELRYRVSLNKE